MLHYLRDGVSSGAVVGVGWGIVKSVTFGGTQSSVFGVEGGPRNIICSTFFSFPDILEALPLPP